MLRTFRPGDQVIWDLILGTNTHTGYRLRRHFGKGPFFVLRIEALPLTCRVTRLPSLLEAEGHRPGKFCPLCIRERVLITGHTQRLYIRADQDFPITAAYFMHAPEPRKESA